MAEASAAHPGARQIAAIGGMRALAVLAVVAFHLDPDWLPGGFVGVDMFFVISGFVVAHSVAGTEPASFRDYLTRFYRRRFLRILPAMLVFVPITIALGVLFIPASEASRFIEATGIASLFGASNLLLLWKTGDYFAATSDYNSFTHTWSLAVEEQYYLLFPILSYALIARRGGGARGRRMATIAVWAACIASLIACAWLTAHWRSFAFYMLPARFWELGLGFLLRHHGERLVAGAWVRPAGGVALASLLGSLWFTPADAFPFPAALWVCLSTALLIAAAWRAPGGWTDRLLSLPMLTFIGAISYSLYLWHWAVVVLMRWTVGLDTLPLKLIALMLMTGLAIGSYRLVERPLRHDRRLLSLRSRSFFGGAAVTAGAVAALCGALLVIKPAVGLAASNDAAIWSPYVARAGSDAACPIEANTTRFGAGWEIALSARCAGARGAPLFVMGDSHAGAYRRMLGLVAGAERREVRAFTLGNCRLVDVEDAPPVSGCAAFRQAATAAIMAGYRPGAVLFLPGLYTPRYRDQWGEAVAGPAGGARAATIAASAATVRRFVDRGFRVIVEAPKPTLPTALYRCADWFNRGSAYCAAGWRVPRAEIERRRARPLAALRAIAGDAGARLWDPTPILCDHACDGYGDGRPLYFDTDHLSGYGNELLFPHFRAALHRRGGVARPPTPAGTSAHG